MKRFLIAAVYMLLPAIAPAGETLSNIRELIVANIDADSPVCRIRVPLGRISCTSESCEIPAPRASSFKSVQLLFSCLPTSARTGFEDPPADAKVFSLKASDKNVEVSLIDDPLSEPGERMRHLSFCFYGKHVTFCGYAKTLRIKDGDYVDASAEVISFIKTIVLVDD
jgi:hypothetical protein